MREIWGLIPGPVKLDTLSPTARHRCDVLRSCVVQVLTARMSPATHYTLPRNTARIMKIEISNFFIEFCENLPMLKTKEWIYDLARNLKFIWDHLC